MEQFLLDILGWERKQAQWLYTLCDHFKFVVDSFPIMLESADYAIEDALYNEEVSLEMVETAILQHLILERIEDDNFRLSSDIQNSNDLIIKSNYGEDLVVAYDDYDSPSYQELTALRDFIRELRELYDGFWNPSSVVKVQSETPVSNPVEKFVCKTIYGRKTSRR